MENSLDQSASQTSWLNWQPSYFGDGAFVVDEERTARTACFNVSMSLLDRGVRSWNETFRRLGLTDLDLVACGRVLSCPLRCADLLRWWVELVFQAESVLPPRVIVETDWPRKLLSCWTGRRLVDTLYMTWPPLLPTVVSLVDRVRKLCLRVVSVAIWPLVESLCCCHWVFPVLSDCTRSPFTTSGELAWAPMVASSNQAGGWRSGWMMWSPKQTDYLTYCCLVSIVTKLSLPLLPSFI